MYRVRSLLTLPHTTPYGQLPHRLCLYTPLLQLSLGAREYNLLCYAAAKARNLDAVMKVCVRAGAEQQ